MCDFNIAGFVLTGGQLTTVEVDVVCDFASCDINLDGVVNFDDWVGITDGTGITSGQVRDSLCASPDLADLAQLVL